MTLQGGKEKTEKGGRGEGGLWLDSTGFVAKERLEVRTKRVSNNHGMFQKEKGKERDRQDAIYSRIG